MSKSVSIENYTLEELLEEAKNGWNAALDDMYYPPIPEPTITFDPKQSDYFYIQTDDWRVILNIAGIPQKVIAQTRDFIRSMSHHEISHYTICPYDGIMNARLLNAALDVLTSMEQAQTVVNIFADLVIDTVIFQRFPELITWRLANTVENILETVESPGDLWRVLVGAYQHMWNMGFGVRLNDTLDGIALEISRIVHKKMLQENTWPGKVKKIARLLKDILDKEIKCENDTAGGENSDGDGSSDGESSRDDDSSDDSSSHDADGNAKSSESIPEELKKQMGNPTIPQGKKLTAADLEQVARELIKDNAKFKNFRKIASLHGGTDKKDALRIWYRSIAKEQIEFEVELSRKAGELPQNLIQWRIGDPIEELDVLQSLQSFPVLIPNMTTRKWHKKSSFLSYSKKEDFDLLIVLDSSGSMEFRTNPRLGGIYHIALVASFSALEFAKRRNAHAAAINFSEFSRSQPWTKNYKAVEDVLLYYYGGGTTLPVKKIRQMSLSAKNRFLTLIITDLGLSNWNPALNLFDDLLNSKNPLVFFAIGIPQNDVDKLAEKLIEKGAIFYGITNIQDLVGLVVNTAKRFL